MVPGEDWKNESAVSVNVPPQTKEQEDKLKTKRVETELYSSQEAQTPAVDMEGYRSQTTPHPGLEEADREDKESQETFLFDGLPTRKEPEEDSNSDSQTKETSDPNPVSAVQIQDRKRRNRRRNREAETSRLEKQRTKMAAVWSELVQARRFGTILSGEIIGCKVVSGQTSVLAIILFGGVYRVVIPFEELYADFPITEDVDTSTPQGIGIFITRQRAMLEKMYGASTPFLVKDLTHSEDGSYVVIGSRSEAIQRRAAANFKPDEYGNAVMEAGDLVSAEILAVGEHSILVNAGGVDSRIPVRNLSYRYLPNSLELGKYFQVGQEIPVVILEVQVNEAGHYTCLLSGRRAELEESKDRHYLFNAVGDMTFGTITSVFRRKDREGVTVLLYIDSYDLPAVASSVTPNGIGRYPMPGDRVRVSFRQYNEETGMTYVGIRGNHGMPRP